MVVVRKDQRMENQRATMSSEEQLEQLRKLTDEVIHSHDTVVKAQEILSFMPNPMLLVNESGKIIYANPEAYAIFRYDIDHNELFGMSINELVPPEFRERHEHEMEKYMHNATVRIMMGRNLSGYTKDGKYIAMQIGLAPLYIKTDLYVLVSIG